MVEPGTAAIATLATIAGVSGYGAMKLNSNQDVVVEQKVQERIALTEERLKATQEALQAVETAKSKQDAQLAAIQKELEMLRQAKSSLEQTPAKKNLFISRFFPTNPEKREFTSVVAPGDVTPEIVPEPVLPTPEPVVPAPQTFKDSTERILNTLKDKTVNDLGELKARASYLRTLIEDYKASIVVGVNDADSQYGRMPAVENQWREQELAGIEARIAELESTSSPSSAPAPAPAPEPTPAPVVPTPAPEPVTSTPEPVVPGVNFPPEPTSQSESKTEDNEDRVQFAPKRSRPRILPKVTPPSLPKPPAPEPYRFEPSLESPVRALTAAVPQANWKLPPVPPASTRRRIPGKLGATRKKKLRTRRGGKQKNVGRTRSR